MVHPWRKNVGQGPRDRSVILFFTQFTAHVGNAALRAHGETSNE
jgi:hypothetical protein